FQSSLPSSAARFSRFGKSSNRNGPVNAGQLMIAVVTMAARNATAIRLDWSVMLQDLELCMAERIKPPCGGFIRRQEVTANQRQLDGRYLGSTSVPEAPHCHEIEPPSLVAFSTILSPWILVSSEYAIVMVLSETVTLETLLPLIEPAGG